MKLQYLGHACFRIISEMGTTVVCDPYNPTMVGVNMPSVRCDVVTVSHHHDDHDCLQRVLGSPAEIDCQIACAADDIAVESYQTFHDDKQGKFRGKNFVFTFVVDGIRVAHLGDVGCLDEEIAGQLKNFDVILLPVGGTYTVDCFGAKWYVDKINPKIVVPMHYKTVEHNFEIDGVDKFLSQFEQDQVFYVGDTVNFADDPQNEKTLVYVMELWQE